MTSHPIAMLGSGFVAAPRQMARGQRGFVADAGFVVASVTYRTVIDDATFREGLEDVCAAIAYLVDDADVYKIATGGAPWGESAGGYLAALAATTCTPVVPVKAVVTIVGGTDVSQISEGLDDAARMPGSARGRRSSATSAVHRPQMPTRSPRSGLPCRPSC